MLKQRIITGLILAPLVLYAVLRLPHWIFASITIVILALAAWEWSRLAGIESLALRFSYLIVITLLMMSLDWGLHNNPILMINTLWIVMLWWLFALISVFRFKNSEAVKDAHPVITNMMATLFIGVILFSGTFLGLVGLRSLLEHGPILLVVLLLLIWIADSGAYFAGRAFGKRKLAPAVSPGKSWEGVIGAMLASVIAIVVMRNAFSLQHIPLWQFEMIGVLTVAISILGDLTESMFKRRIGLKDSGSILPGHGGILDRIDSLTAAAPCFLLCLAKTGVT